MGKKQEQIFSYDNIITDIIPQTTMTQARAERWEQVKDDIKTREGYNSYCNWFRDLRFYGLDEHYLIFSAPTPFTAGHTQDWTGSLLQRGLSPMGRYKILVDTRMSDTAQERLKWWADYRNKWLTKE